MQDFYRKCRENKKLIIAIFILLLGMYYTLFNVSQPYNTAPDEGMKYDVCKYIFNNNRLPYGNEDEIRDPNWGVSYAYQPYLAYIIGALFMKIISIFTLDEFMLVVSARFVSTLSILLFIYFVIKISDELFDGKYKYLFIALISFHPQIAFLASYINNDSMALFSTALIIYSWIKGIKSNFSYKYCTLLGISIGICALTYYNAYGYILCSIILSVAYVIITKMSINDIVKRFIIVALFSFLIAGWWFIRNIIIYDGDVLGMSSQIECAEKYALDEFKPSNRLTPKLKGESIIYMLFKDKWLRGTYKSFIGVFGYLDIQLPNLVYVIVSIIWIFGIVGALLNFKTLFKKEDKLINYVFLISAIIPIILSILYSYASDFQPQGRYIMPMIIPFMYFLTKGIEGNLERYITKDIIRNKIVILIIAISFAILLYSLFGCVIPRYK